MRNDILALFDLDHTLPPYDSDSRNDLPLLSHVTHPLAVNADPVLAAHARLKGWPQIVIE